MPGLWDGDMAWAGLPAGLSLWLLLEPLSDSDPEPEELSTIL